jgi:putative redox protein
MEHEINMNWAEGMSFNLHSDGHEVVFDASEEHGGSDKGPRPKPMLLGSLAACTGMDVVSLLKKMRVEYDAFSIRVTGKLTDEHPKYYHKIHLIYSFKGDNLEESKLKKAIDLSQERYCGVSAMLRKASTLTYEIRMD